MSYFDEIYLKRLNRFGYNYQERKQNQREKEFEDLLLKSVYRIDFEYDDDEHPGILTHYKQDNSEMLGYLLTRVDLNIGSGTILEIPNKDGILKPWMIYWLEEMQASGYNRYIVLRMTHTINWVDRDGNDQSSWAYLYGQEDNMLRDEIKSRSRMDTVYEEDMKESFIVLPRQPYLRKDDYFTIGDDELKQGFRVTGYDTLSTPGVEFVSIDPVYLYDETPAPIQMPEDNPDDFYWLNGGDTNGRP